MPLSFKNPANRMFPTDYFGNPTSIVMILEIDKYGNAIQFAKSSTGAGEYELIDLKYDRRAQKLCN